MDWIRSKLTNVESGRAIDLGSDHLCLEALFNFSRPSRKNKHKLQTTTPLWPPSSVDDYTAKLEELLDDALVAEALHDKYCKIQAAIAEASQHASAPPRAESEKDKPCTKLQQLIEERRSMPNADAANRKTISKEIGKEVKKIKERS